MRLRILHEIRIRLTPQWARRYSRDKKRQTKNLAKPKGPHGNVLEGLEYLEVGEEIWMHVAPTKDELTSHGVEMKGASEEEGGGMVEVTGNHGRAREGEQGH